jgi:capsular polysaccharide biosynthesis protein
MSRYLAAAAHVYAIKGGYVLGDEGAIATPDRELIISTVSRPSIIAVDHPSWKLPDHAANIVRFDGVAAAITHHGPRSFSHVVADCLPRIWLVRRAGVEPEAWIVPASDESWQNDLLSLAGVAPNKRIYARDDLERRGFEVLVPEAAEVRDQALKAATAEVIAGPHGGGLCWPLASPKEPGLLFEVAAPTLVHNDYQAVAAVCGWKYDRTAAIGDFSASEANWHDDIVLEPEVVLHSLDAALSSFEQDKA